MTLVSLFNFEQILHNVLGFNLLTLNKKKADSAFIRLDKLSGPCYVTSQKMLFLQLIGFRFLLFSSAVPLVITAITAGVATDYLGPKTEDDIQL